MTQRNSGCLLITNVMESISICYKYRNDLLLLFQGSEKIAFTVALLVYIYDT